MIVSKNFQGRGLGKALLMHAKKYGGELSGWVIDNEKYEIDKHTFNYKEKP